MTKCLAEVIAALRDLPDSVQNDAAKVLIRYLAERLQMETDFGSADRDIRA